ncbi:MAG: methylmalonyl Co-A mutase-associated GTPase MeaB [Chitinophagaceae bacterium]|nr:methylmalonyl Co-A mutase-associated GTPase MeaB [Chitinophagaceae bacterium]
MWVELLNDIRNGSITALARAISFIENERDDHEQLLQQLPASDASITGITGPPGAGKSTLTDALIGECIKAGKRTAVLCVDPSSPFHHGALLGDRIRMSEWYNDPNVFIRSLATRGNLGGLHPKILEIADLVKAAGFKEIIIETVGVGQSEIEIAGLADTTVVVTVPESGDEVQTMKAGLMEIADIFVVNKSDRPEADRYVSSLRQMLAPAFQRSVAEIPILKTIATQKEGIDILYQKILDHRRHLSAQKKSWLFVERAYHLIRQQRMKNITREDLLKAFEANPTINLYQFVLNYSKQ